MDQPKGKRKIPDFFIAGAMKSGTSSVYALLKKHPSICISIPKETALMMRDDVCQRPFYFWQYYEEWKEYDWIRVRKRIESEYQPYFVHAREGQLLGEATPTYLASERAPRHIHDVNPDARIIILLRDPVDRAYSHYWHMVSKSMAIYPLAKQLTFEPSTILQRSLYKEQIQRYYDVFDRKQIKIFLFEEFVLHPQACVDAWCDFLGVEKCIQVETSTEESAQNRAQTPRFIGFHLFLNRLQRMAGADFSSKSIRKKNPMPKNSIHRLLDRIQDWNLIYQTYPPMNPSVRKQLEAYFVRENRGLGEMIGIDLGKYWTYFQENT